MSSDIRRTSRKKKRNAFNTPKGAACPASANIYSLGDTTISRRIYLASHTRWMFSYFSRKPKVIYTNDIRALASRGTSNMICSWLLWFTRLRHGIAWHGAACEPKNRREWVAADPGSVKCCDQAPWFARRLTAWCPCHLSAWISPKRIVRWNSSSPPSPSFYRFHLIPSSDKIPFLPKMPLWWHRTSHSHATCATHK